MPAHFLELLTVRKQIDPLSHHFEQVGLAFVIVEGDLFWVAGADDLHTGLGHEPENGYELNDGKANGKDHLEDKSQRDQYDIQYIRAEDGPDDQTIEQSPAQDPKEEACRISRCRPNEHA